MGTWYLANGFGIALGGLLGFGIGNIDGSLPSWKFEFLIIGAWYEVRGRAHGKNHANKSAVCLTSSPSKLTATNLLALLQRPSLKGIHIFAELPAD